ncbi:MAG: ATP-binding protein [Tunicatimonas sp.]
MITEQALEKILADLETDRVEKTASTNNYDKFGEAICAFSNDIANNQTPGYLAVGVKDDGSRDGLKVSENLLQLLMDFRTDGRIVPPPSLTVIKLSYPDGEVAVVEVQPSFQPPVRYKGKVCIRVGLRRGIANEAEERRLSEKRSSFARSFDTLPCYGSTLEDLSLDTFKMSYLPSAVDAQVLEDNHRDTKEQLSSLKFYDSRADCPTNVGILVFGRNPRFYLQSAYVQYVRFQGKDETSEFDYEHRFEGDLTTQLRVMDEFIRAQVVRRVQHNLGENYRMNYPAVALKELLYNAVIHRDYQSNAFIKFYQFSDRIEITNPGGLYGDARPENFPNVNDYRNPSLAEAVKNLGYVNTFNVGVKRALASLAENQNPEPKFTHDRATSFSVEIYSRTI